MSYKNRYDKKMRFRDAIYFNPTEYIFTEYVKYMHDGLSIV